jgi:hypothetical protein
VFTALAGTLGEDHWAWHRPSFGVSGRRYRPHFVLTGPGYGILVLRVEPWRAQDIVQGTQNWILLRVGKGQVARREHPQRRVQETAFALGRRLEAVSGRGGAGQSPPPPVGSGVVLPLVRRRDLAPLRARGVPFRDDRILTADDLEEAPPSLAGALNRLREAPFPRAPDAALREQVRAVVEPQLHFLDLREPPPETGAEPRTVSMPSSPHTAPTPSTAPPVPIRSSAPSAATLPGFWLDRKQERMARQLASPRALVYGPAGSGKTVFLMARAEYWLDSRPESRVLFTCYNASLASHLRRTFAARRTPSDEERLTVRHYHDLCGFVLGMTDIHDRSPEFYAALEPKVLQALSQREDVPAYDLILVDEGQDFTRRMLEVLVRLSSAGGEITVVCDPAQDIYGRWAPENLSPFRQHDVEQLLDCYRNTAPIFALALGLLTPEVRAAMGLSRLEMTRPEDLGRVGPVPELVAVAGLDELAALICGLVRSFHEEHRALSEMAVLYSDRGAIPGFGPRLRRSRWLAAKDPRFDVEDEEPEPPDGDIVRGTLHPQSDRDDSPPSGRPHFAEALEIELRSREVPVEWVVRNFAAKAAYDISKERLTLSTVHSVKGMDFHTVVLLGAESLRSEPSSTAGRARSLLFTGVTRARERLLIPYFEDGGWVPELRERLKDIETSGAR